MIVLGIVLLIVGLLAPAVSVLVYIGGVLIVVGLVLAALHMSGHGRLYY